MIDYFICPMSALAIGALMLACAPSGHTRADPSGHVAQPGDLRGDRDGDDIVDPSDRCPDEPEDVDGYRDDDGCPDVDDDGDAVLDVDDLCPAQREDHDGFEDRDGCPDPDNDGDQIADHVDQCPDEPEHYNGIDDDDGCSDVGTVHVHTDFVEILDVLSFRDGQAVLTPGQEPIVDVVAATLKANPDIEVVAVIGRAIPGEPDPRALSVRRAERVRALLVARGIDPARLAAHGVGTRAPTRVGPRDLAPRSVGPADRTVLFSIRRIGGEDVGYADIDELLDGAAR